MSAANGKINGVCKSVTGCITCDDVTVGYDGAKVSTYLSARQVLALMHMSSSKPAPAPNASKAATPFVLPSMPHHDVSFVNNRLKVKIDPPDAGIPSKSWAQIPPHVSEVMDAEPFDPYHMSLIAKMTGAQVPYRVRAQELCAA